MLLRCALALALGSWLLGACPYTAEAARGGQDSLGVASEVALEAPVAAGADERVDAPGADVTLGAADARRAARLAREQATQQRFRSLSLVRAGIALAGFAVFGWGIWLARRGRGERLLGVRLALLCTLAVASFAAYYNFFGLHHPGGFKSADVYHYYMGSKYFGELGYFELYPCTLAALVDAGRLDPLQLPDVRDQRTLRVQSPEVTRAALARCPERFAAERWGEFKRDVAFFRPRLLGGSWTHLLIDHGYNPTPVWSFVGGLFSGHIAADSAVFPRLIQIDRVLAIAIAMCIAWAFGLEAACLAALVWGASPLWSYNWIGDAFLRNLWLFSTVAGLCLLERGRHFGGGAWLATAAWLRVFPGLFAAGFLAHGLAHAFRWRSGRDAQAVPVALRRLVAGAALASLVLLAGSLFGTGRGPGAWLEFREKMGAVVSEAGVNKIGLSALANELVRRATTFEVTTPEGAVVKLPKPALVVVGAVRTLQTLIVLLGLAAFWRALGRVRGAEAAMLAFALLPLLTSPMNYYYPLVLAAAMLAPRRPWIGAALALALLGWIAGDQIWFLEDARYLVWDAVAIAFSLAVLLGVALTPPPDDAQATTTA
jgi:hypothetical protein